MLFVVVFGVVANACGILSFVLGIFTLATTRFIKKSLAQRVEREDYLKDVDAQIVELQAYYETLLKDETLYTEVLLQQIDAKLEDISVAYETILEKKTITQIEKTRRLIKYKCIPNIGNTEYKRECISNIHAICTRLKKVKKLL